MFIERTFIGKLFCLLFKKHRSRIIFFNTFPNKVDARLQCIYCGKLERLYS